MNARGRALRVFALMIAAMALAISNRAIGVVGSTPSAAVVAAPASERLPGSAGTSSATRRLEETVDALGPDLEGLDTDDRDDLQDDVDKAIERVDKKLEDIENDLEKREDDLNDDLENTNERQKARAKLDELEEDLRALRRRLSDIRSAAQVGIDPASVLEQVHTLGAGILAIEAGIDELDELVKAAEQFEDDDD